MTTKERMEALEVRLSDKLIDLKKQIRRKNCKPHLVARYELYTAAEEALRAALIKM